MLHDFSEERQPVAAVNKGGIDKNHTIVPSKFLKPVNKE